MSRSSTPAPARPDASEEAVLKRRAALVAQPEQRLATVLDTGELLVAGVGAARYALPLVRLAGVTRLPGLTRLPGAPPFIAGVAHVQGRTMSVVSLAVLLGEQPAAPTFGVLVEEGGEVFALGVDRLDGVQPRWGAAEAPVPEGIPARARRAILAVGPGGVCLLALERIIDELTAGEQAGTETRP